MKNKPNNKELKYEKLDKPGKDRVLNEIKKMIDEKDASMKLIRKGLARQKKKPEAR